MTEENEDKNLKEKTDLDKFEAIASRGPRKDVYEYQQGTLIKKATTTNDPLIKIMTIGEAAFSSKKSDKLDLSLVERLFSVAQDFSDATPATNKKHIMRIDWSFEQTKENYESHIKPWQKTNVGFYALETHYRYKNYPPKLRYNTESAMWWKVNEEQNRVLDELDELKTYITNKIREMPEHEKFFEISYALSVNGFRKLKAEFTRWALKQLSETRNKLLKEISPDVWKDLTRAREEDESINEDKMDSG